MKITVEVPASSANLGVGYDVLALALDLHLRVSVEREGKGEGSLTVAGEGADRLGLDDSNRFLAGLRRGLRELATEPVTLHVEMANQIPLGRGLGSSAAATVAGLLVAEALAGQSIGTPRMVGLAAEVEGHPDNAAAALYGGFVVVADGEVVRYDPPTGLRAALFVPDRELATDEMRHVIPLSVPHADAVHNMAHAAMLVSAFATGQLALLGVMYGDRLHEPYRAAVFPELPRMKEAARAAGALGAALSGAGSALIALCDGDASAAGVAEALSAHAAQIGLAGRAVVLAPATNGARLID